MPETRLLHISDTHLGKRQYGSDVRRDDFADTFDQAINLAAERDVDAVIHTGDLFDDPVPSLPTVMRCADALEPLEERGIPFYGIVGNHERKNDDQWLDLLRRTNAVTRLDREPTVVGDVALYGIDAVRPSVWDTADFGLEASPEDAECSILCMHELLEPPAEEIVANHSVEDVLERVNVELDGLALGDLHQPKSAHVDGTDVWYASATERCAKDQLETGLVQLLEIDDGELTRRQLELETRPWSVFHIAFSEDDGADHVRDVLDRRDLENAVAKVELTGERGAVTANEVIQMARDAGAAVVSVDDNRGRVDIDVDSIEAMSLQGLDSAIEERLADEDLSEVALDIDGRVREGDGLNDTVGGAADDLEPDLRDAQQAAFDDIGEPNENHDTTVTTEGDE
ncbi:metallophosphoesterase [Natrinema hispanicum]|uniref:DNA repair exonuclease SbcCD nuclease subunit n=1 Tax=Natrinema hispanicum TaxID=392421 RepID=A0A1I0HPW2_9EURY|nr:metallophosphoesterase [Natrinema hispanicum]RZV05159.1 DNA repair exonuclease SbcCD nuclease subunit [Natrinema hispanicum]SET85304.1 DNA repair exonuclease SbcCD nuclease subunit [Natrinema hispanicum]